MDGRDLPVHHRGPGLAQRREERAHRVQLLGGQGPCPPVYASDFAQPVIGRKKGERDAPARCQKPFFQERRYHQNCHGL